MRFKFFKKEVSNEVKPENHIFPLPLPKQDEIKVTVVTLEKIAYDKYTGAPKKQTKILCKWHGLDFHMAYTNLLHDAFKDGFVIAKEEDITHTEWLEGKYLVNVVGE